MKSWTLESVAGAKSVGNWRLARWSNLHELTSTSVSDVTSLRPSYRLVKSRVRIFHQALLWFFWLALELAGPSRALSRTMLHSLARIADSERRGILERGVGRGVDAADQR